MTRTPATGETCVGDVRLSPLDCGFDPRAHDMVCLIPAEFGSVGIEQDGEVYLVEGTRQEMLDEVRVAGYRVGHELPPAPEVAPGVRDYWAAVTDVPCPACSAGTVRWAEAGTVPGWRRCDGCGREFLAGGDGDRPTLAEQDD